MLLVSGSANRPLSARIAAILQTQLVPVAISRFPDGETHVEILENVHDNDVFIIQPTCSPVNDNIIELCLLADALQRAEVGRIIAVIPYFGYARQDCRHYTQTSIAARVIAEMLAAVKISAVIAVDLHCEQMQEFFSMPLINLRSSSVFLRHPLLQQLHNPVVVAPDFGAITRAHDFAKNYNNADIAIIEKQRTGSDLRATNLIGAVANRDCIIIDDIIATGATLGNAIQVLCEQGANKIYVFATHGVFASGALENLAAAKCELVVCTDSIPLNPSFPSTKLQQLSLAPLIAAAISEHMHFRRNNLPYAA